MIDTKVKTLLTLVSTGSFTKAAELLSLSQPAVSHHIKQLEEEFQIKLFYRDKKELKLTQEGEILVKYARRAAAVSNNAKQAIEDSRRDISRISIGITPTAGENLIPHVLAAYCNQHDKMHINICTDTIHNIYDKLKSYELDVAIVEGNINNPSYKSILLDTDYLCLCVSPQHPLAGRSSVSLQEIKGEKFILRSESAGTRLLFENYLIGQFENIRNLDIIMEIDNVATIKELVAHNLGISVIAYSALREEEASGKLSIVPIENSSMVREINMVYHRDFSHINVLDGICQLYKKMTRSAAMPKGAQIKTKP